MQRSPLRELECFGECRQVSSRLEGFRGTVLHVAEVASSTQSTARLVQFWVLAGLSSAGLTHSTLKVYVAALAYQAPLGGQSVDRLPPLYTFLSEA